LSLLLAILSQARRRGLFLIGALVALAIIAQAIPVKHHHFEQGLHSVDCPFEKLATSRDSSLPLESEDRGAPLTAHASALIDRPAEVSSPSQSLSPSRAPPQIA
jgi:hypothetical protein